MNSRSTQAAMPLASSHDLFGGDYDLPDFAAAPQVGFVPHIVPHDGYYCEESWSEWQDLRLDLLDIEIFEVFERGF